ncbi:MAG: bifunctional methylenetetrahydrofolate dehydrogenase/methenyltetrahydrofolate cyclohydrolase, partial [Thaumarchaeota archaeon]|nr:bifunctional methylenetetrahydrofolate dehydrogenase/methenyltetrahydrofolate cyclohydrolase [Nitrososphaerota archaeon]
MSYKTLTGKEPAEEVLKDAEARAKKLKRPPHLAVVVVGEFKPTQIYVRKKVEMAEKIGVKATVHRFPDELTENELLELLRTLNDDNSVDGYIVQTPLPKHINPQHIFDRIDPHKDVDGFHPKNMGKVLLNLFDDNMFPPATPYGVMRILHHYNAPLEGANAVVIGRSNIVGKPVAMMLLHNNATVSVCHSKTKDLRHYTKNADIIIAAAGAPGLLTADMVKEG